jgi:hypothetical protein
MLKAQDISTLWHVYVDNLIIRHDLGLYGPVAALSLKKLLDY